MIAEAGISKNTFYYHFPSKEDLCLAYLQERHKVWMGWLQAGVDKYETPYQRLMGVFEFLESWLKECDFRGCAFLNIASEVPDINHRFRKMVVDHKEELRFFLRALLDDLKRRDPQFAGIDPEFLTKIFYVIVEGIIGSCQIYGNTALIDAARQNIDQLLRVAP